MDATDDLGTSHRRSAEPEHPTGWGRLAAILTATMVAGTIGQFAVSALGPMLIEDFSMSRFEFGAIQSAYFLVAAVLSPLLGPLTDRVGGRRMLLGMLAWQALALVAVAFSDTYAVLVITAALAGVGAAASNPVTNRLVIVAGREDRRGLLVGVKQSGPWLGAVIAGSVLAPVGAATGWRTSFLVAAAVVACLAVPARLSLSRTERRPARGDRVKLSRGIWRLVPYAFLMGVGGSGLSAYLAVFAHEALSLSKATAGLALAALGVAAVLGRVAWGRFTERRHDPRVPLRLVAGIAFPAQLVLAASALFTSLPLFWVAVVVLGVTAVSWNTVAMVAVTREASVDETGRASGVVLTGFYVGLLVGPAMTGALLDVSGSYTIAWTVIAALFFAASGVASTRAISAQDTSPPRATER